MKTVVLDAAELSRDFLCRGLKYQLLEHTDYPEWLSVKVPASVFEEVVANHTRKAEAAKQALEKLNAERNRLGLGRFQPTDPPADFYREFLADRFDRQLGVEILPWPTMCHEDLVSRAVARTAPFDEKGGGYQDSLVWASVLELAEQGHDIALVSADRAFANADDKLRAVLVAEVDGVRERWS